MVVDLGGGTLDVSLLSVQGGMFVTMRLVDHVIATAGDVRDPDQLQKLFQGVEKAKLELTDNQWALINIDDFPTMNITREQFESINADLFLKVLDPVRRVLDVVKGTADDVDEVVLVGGSTRVPRIRALIRDFFGGMEPNVGVNPDLAVTTGVALQAGIIGGAWPLQVSAIEQRNRNIEKIHLE
ncbi:endoplasmic reticulum chaperone BiP-like [Oscarella lobularis]|uniref:endoplasmic reticulum chaperone BiP-like n=1 Tax=Oscarella lobularis TaxID=121494 RepID=UPI003313F090